MTHPRCLPALLTTSLGLLILMFSAGCSALSLPDLPTPYPTEYLPTVLAMTVEAGKQARTASVQPSDTLPAATPPPLTQTDSIALPSATLSPDNTQPPASATPTAGTPLPTPTRTRTRIPSKTPTITPTPGIPPSEIQLLRPGPMSKVASPLDIAAYYDVVPDGYMLIELLAEPLQPEQDGRMLLTKLQRFIGAEEAFFTTFTQELDFEIGRLSEFAVLRFSTYDSYERPASVSSVDLVLLQVGNSEIKPPGSLLSPIAIFEPSKNKLIQGGTLSISGMTRPEGDQILHFELVTTDQHVLGTRDLFTIPAPDGKHIPFSTNIDYQVSKTTWVRLVAYYLDVRIPGYRQLSSVPVLLSP